MAAPGRSTTCTCRPALANGSLVEHHYLAGEFCRRIYKNLPMPAEGWLVLPETPGLGFEPDHDAVKEVAHAL